MKSFNFRAQDFLKKRRDTTHAADEANKEVEQDFYNIREESKSENSFTFVENANKNSNEEVIYILL